VTRKALVLRIDPRRTGEFSSCKIFYDLKKFRKPLIAPIAKFQAKIPGKLET
jgi:hypothetical protein